MAIRDILEIGHPALLERAAEVDLAAIASAEVQGWIDDMIDTLRSAHGAGIAANQVGIPYRVFVIEVGDNPRYPYKPSIPLTVVINPEIEFLGEATFPSNEGCLSVPRIRGVVERHLELSVAYHDRDGQRINRVVRGYSACTWQHEYDHLDGILFPQRVTDPRSFCSWDVFREHYQEAFAQEVRELVATWGA